MSLTAEEAVTILTKSSLPSLKNEHPVTKNVVGAIPADRVDYRPDGIARSALDLAWHLCASELRFLKAVAAGAFDFTGAARPESIRTPAQIVEWYAERFQEDYERLKGLSGEELTRRVDFRGLFTFPAVIYLQIGLNHSIHHRGQLSTYLRPMGVKVPSIYGESYDAKEAREKAQAAAAKP